MKSRKLSRIEKSMKLVRMQNLSLYGNAHDYKELLLLTNEIACDEDYSDFERVMVINKLEDAMGEKRSTGSAYQIVKNYMQEMKDAGLA